MSRHPRDRKPDPHTEATTAHVVDPSEFTVPDRGHEVPVAAIAKSVRWMRGVLVGFTIPLVMAASLVVKLLYDRAETATADRIERARMLEDVRDLKRTIGGDDGRGGMAGKIRDAEEALRTHSQRLDFIFDLVQSRSNRKR